MEYFLLAFKRTFDFKGRARRKEYWMFILLIVIFLFIIGFISDIIGDEAFGYLLGTYIIIIIIPVISVTVRRLHDTNRSGSYIFIRFIPFIGNLWLLSLMCQKGDPYKNKYGPDPKNPTTELDEIGVAQE